MIGGVVVGVFFIGNGLYGIMYIFKDFGKFIFGFKWKGQDYCDFLCLMYLLIKIMKIKGVIVFELYIENLFESVIFMCYFKLQKDYFCMYFICDMLCMMMMNFEDFYQVEDVMEKQLEKYYYEVEYFVYVI